MKQLAVLEQLYQTPRQCAEQQQLIYLEGDVPGFLRKRWGRGFRYFDPEGKAVKSPEIKQRLADIEAPPAWKNVWLAPEDNFHVLARGNDVAGRTQYTYHPRWLDYRNRLKYYHLLTFSESLPRLRRRAYGQLNNPYKKTAPKETVLALMVMLLDKGALRIGSEYYYEQRETVGLTTLLWEHVTLKGPRIELCYLAKSGKERCIRIQNKKLAGMLRALRTDSREQDRVFRYDDAQGQKQTLSGEQLNHYLNGFSAFAISAKDFRTWIGTLTAYRCMRKGVVSEDAPTLSEIESRTAEVLGNTPAVARSSYIHSDLMALYKSGDFEDYYQKLTTSQRKAYFSKDEAELQELLLVLFEEKMAYLTQ